MKTFLGVVAAALLAGCATPHPVALNTVGPNPSALPQGGPDGQLQVLSALSAHVEGNNPSWFQHSDYFLYDQNGHRLKFVSNNTGHYSRSARSISLPPGKYLVKARAEHAMWVDVPVVVEAGRVTRVHLDDLWHPAADTANELVAGPAGYPIGWTVTDNR